MRRRTNLEHGGDARATCHHADLADLVGLDLVALADIELTVALVCEASLGALHGDGVADFHVVEVL